jgi:hypothetical protein
MGSADHGPRVRCATCGELIGVYEPLVLVTPDGARATSIAAEPELLATGWAGHHPGCIDHAGDDARAER